MSIRKRLLDSHRAKFDGTDPDDTPRVKEFQGFHGLKTDGIVGPKTRAKAAAVNVRFSRGDTKHDVHPQKRTARNEWDYDKDGYLPWEKKRRRRPKRAIETGQPNPGGRTERF